MVSLCNTLLPNDRVQAIPAVIGSIFKPIPVIDRVKEVDFAAILTIESVDSKIVFSVLQFFYIFFDLWFFLRNKQSSL